MSNAIVPVQSDLASQENYRGITMVTSPAEALRRMQELQAFVAEVMKEGTDFGIIPGTDKPTLLQPGAQKLAEIYGFAIDFEDAGSIEDFDRPLFAYKKKCVLTSRRDGRFICAAVGSCNSREERYAARWVYESDVPAGIDKKTLRVKEFTSKRNGSKFKKYRLPNEDLFSLVNTIEKMACKRALVGAVISATRSSGVFTQDAEDLPPEAFGQVDDVRPWQTQAAAPATNAPRETVAEAEIVKPAGPAIDESEVQLIIAACAAADGDAELRNARDHATKIKRQLTGDQMKRIVDAVTGAQKRLAERTAA